MEVFDKMDEHLLPTSCIAFEPLNSDINVTALKTFENTIQTCIGPYGKLKIVQNAAGGNVTVTSSSQRLLSIVSIQNTFLKLIVASVKSHLNYFGNDGLSCTLLILKLINNSLLLTYPLPLIGKLYECFGKIFIDCLNMKQNACVINMDFSEINNIMIVVQSILQSKPGCILTQNNKKHLTLLLMKIYLNSIPHSSSFPFFTLEGINCNQSQLYEGLLITISGMPVNNLTSLENKSLFKIILFTVSLSGDAEFPVDKIEVNNHVNLWETVLTFLKNVMKKVIEAKVQVLACQKVVHPSLRKQLENANILVLDRLGYELAKKLEYLTGCSNASVFGEMSFGFLTSIRKETIGRKQFLLLSNNQNPFWTMLICNFNEQAVNETQAVCHQALDALYRLLQKPLVCYGAGCTEIYTSRLVENKVLECLDEIQQEMDCTRSQVLEALHMFSKSLTDLAVAVHQGSNLDFVSERVHNHLWRLNDNSYPKINDRCMCGKFSPFEVSDSDWYFLDKALSELAIKTDICPVENKDIGTINRSMILDDINSKLNAFSVAFETASLLLRVSVCISS